MNMWPWWNKTEKGKAKHSKKIKPQVPFVLAQDRIRNLAVRGQRLRCCAIPHFVCIPYWFVLYAICEHSDPNLNNASFVLLFVAKGSDVLCQRGSSCPHVSFKWPCGCDACNQVNTKLEQTLRRKYEM